MSPRPSAADSLRDGESAYLGRRDRRGQGLTDHPPGDWPSETLSFDWSELRSQLLTWYGDHGRSLPWRHTRDAYAIWVSEIMLQQTQVATVLPYYQRWLTQFPTVQALAAADLQTVLKLWEGLGYYARPRRLHQAAQHIVHHHQGQIPRCFDQILALPGIGRTTAGGILSAAFNLPYAILDGNVKRVLARLVALPVPPDQALNHLWQLSEQLLDPDRPRDFNQALMDLGATLCRSHQPNCHRCPWQAHCRAYHLNLQSQIPMTRAKAPLPHKHIGVAVIWNDRQQVLIDQRKPEGLLGGLWEFPGGKLEPGETVEECIRREILEELGIIVAVGDHLCTVTHAYSHFKVTLQVHHCTHLSGDPQPLACDQIRWVRVEELTSYPFPKANLEIIRALATHAARQPGQ